MHRPIRSSLAVVLLAASVIALMACKRTRTPTSAAPPKTPTVRLYVVSTLAGAMEPCGCQEDMLGGIDHAAAYMSAQSKTAPDALLVGAGPMLFMDPTAEASRGEQDRWKADAIAQSLGEMGLVGWAPGANDWALGGTELVAWAKKATATLFAGNLVGAVGAVGAKTVRVGAHVVGIAGVSRPTHPAGAPESVKIAEPKVALEAARSELLGRKSEILVALAALDRGEALRLAEQVDGFDVLVVGKPYDRGEGNDAVTPPVLIGETLVVQAPNHLQSLVVVDLFVRDDFVFQDGSGIELVEKRASLERRVTELSGRIASWEKQEDVAKADVAARKKDLEKLEAELKALPEPAAPARGSFFRYHVQDVRERLGSDPRVAKRMTTYYRRVNDHNREAFKDRKPPPVSEGQSSYLGVEDCAGCHDEAQEFWEKTKHAVAYATLEKQHKQFNLDCVSCHVTGYEKPGGTTVTHVEGLKSVQCESCHGPGSRHEDDPENPTLIVASPPKTLCQKCHHPPHVGADWSVDEAWKRIIGPGHGG